MIFLNLFNHHQQHTSASSTVEDEKERGNLHGRQRVCHREVKSRSGAHFIQRNIGRNFREPGEGIGGALLVEVKDAHFGDHAVNHPGTGQRQRARLDQLLLVALGEVLHGHHYAGVGGD